MSGFSENQNSRNNQTYWQPGDQGQSTYNFDMGSDDLDFQTFPDSHSAAAQAPYPSAPLYVANPYLEQSTDPYQGGVFTPSVDYSSHGESADFEDEPPLLEELGINPHHIIQKTLSVLNPFRATDASILQDTDLAGPLVFCLVFGAFLLLAGKVHFSYIYGIGVLGCLSVYCLLSLMTAAGVTLGTVVSVLGYCLLPMVGLAGVNVLLSLQGVVGLVLTGLAIVWCSLSSSKLLVTALSMNHQQVLVAYPCALLYGVFALITIF